MEHRFGMPVLPAADYGQIACRGCGLLYLNAEVSDEYLTDLYSRESVEWQRDYVSQARAWNGGTETEEARRFNKVVDLVASRRSLQGSTWLDFGCQTGELGAIARDQHLVEMFGVEVSSDYAARADALWGSRKRVERSIAPFAQQGQLFDVISCLETLEHIAAPWCTVSAFRKVIAPDGLLIVTVPSAPYFRLKYQVFRGGRTLFIPRSVRNRASRTGRSIFGLCHTHPYNFTPKSLSLLLQRGGFETTYVGGIGWSRRFMAAEMFARVLSALTRGGLQIFPSILAIARPK